MDFAGVVLGVMLWGTVIAGALQVKGCIERGGPPVQIHTARASASRPVYRPAERRGRAATVSHGMTDAAIPEDEDVDLIEHPEYVLDVLTQEAAAAGLNPELPGSIWQLESGEVYGDRGGAGGSHGQEVLAMDQYRIRDHWLGRGTISVLDAPKGGECGYLFRLLGEDPGDVKAVVKAVGNGTRNAWALCLLGKRHGFVAETLWASKGTSTMESRGESFGGCIGPTQITPIEVIQRGMIDLNPLRFRDAIRWLCQRLAREQRRFIQEGHGPARAMQKAVSGYAGRDRDQRYYAKFLKKVREWREMEDAGTLRSFLTDKARRAGAKWRSGRDLYASN